MLGLFVEFYEVNGLDNIFFLTQNKAYLKDSPLFKSLAFLIREIKYNTRQRL